MWVVRGVCVPLLAVEVWAAVVGNRLLVNVSALAVLAVVAVAWAVHSRDTGRG